MRLNKLIVSMLLGLFCFNTSLFSNEFEIDHFFNIYDKYRSVPENLMMMKHKHVIQDLDYIKKLTAVIKVEKVGSSVENRSINLVSFGKGKTKILLWSQMHGDEPTATAALLSIYKYFANNIDDPFVKKLYKNLSIHSVIMLNPDGAERFQRRNVYDIDINRDANMLQTPEGKILKSMQERIKPDYGFNLHNMGGRETVGSTNKILKIALMAPPFNKENKDNPTRVNAKKVAVHLKNVLVNYIDGHVAKYKADYMPRAFGDAMQFWGVSTVLIETGSYTGDDPVFLEKLNFISLLSVFDVIAENRLDEIDHTEYEKIPLEGKSVFDLLIKNVMIVNGEKGKPFMGDVGINLDYKLNKGKIDTIGYIKDIGDLSIYNGKKTIKANNMVLTPGFISVNNEKWEKERYYRHGITTTVGTKIRNNQKILQIPEGKIDFKKIPDFTSLLADNYRLLKKGRIKRNNKADLLLFSIENDSVLDLDNLKYVIINGSIKKTQE